MTRKLPLGIAASVLLAATTASAANLVSRGGTAQVPTYQGANRKILIKAPGTSCPTDFTCICDTGSLCVLPWSLVTGTVVIDRPGVTLDCQNRMIQPPRFADSNQQCTESSQCGEHSSNGIKHECVSGYCQLGNLGGINIGGPFGVDDGSININVDTTGHVPDVEVRNCKVRNHTVGLVAEGVAGDNGVDDLAVQVNEFRTGSKGMYMWATDGSYVFGNNVHDNALDGLEFEYNWRLRVYSNTVNNNGARQVYFHSTVSGRRNRWLDLAGNFVTSTFTPPSSIGGLYGNVIVGDLEGSIGSPCNSDTARCDLKFEANEVDANNDEPGVWLVNSFSNGPTTLLRGNVIRQHDSVVDVLVQPGIDGFHNVPKCWNKGNVCYRPAFDDEPHGCITMHPNEFTNSTCWY